ncbi:hypothetical protein BDW66DRAFT_169467 [Aspergillus desertorum]
MASASNNISLRSFVPTLHSSPYPTIDPTAQPLPMPYTVCIIGGHGASGSALAKSYSSAGCTGLILAARNLRPLQKLRDEIQYLAPNTAITIAECDITSSSSVASLASLTSAAFSGHLDVLIVNAGYSGPLTDSIIDENPDVFAQAFNVNTLGTYHAARHFLPLLLGTPEGAMSFIGISSMSAATVAGPIAHVHYCASKAAQVRVLEMVCEQVRGRGVFVASVHPGGMRSEFSMAVLPAEYQHILTDDPALVGAFCVWLTRMDGTMKRETLNGRFLSCKWDINELEGRYQEILEKDLLRFRIASG